MLSFLKSLEDVALQSQQRVDGGVARAEAKLTDVDLGAHSRPKALKDHALEQLAENRREGNRAVVKGITPVKVVTLQNCADVGAFPLRWNHTMLPAEVEDEQQELHSFFRAVLDELRRNSVRTGC